jgi:hypothetical protein
MPNGSGDIRVSIISVQAEPWDLIPTRTSKSPRLSHQPLAVSVTVQLLDNAFRDHNLPWREIMLWSSSI